MPLLATHGDDGLAADPSLPEYLERLRHSIQRDTAVDYRDQLTGFEDLIEKFKVLPVGPLHQKVRSLVRGSHFPGL